MTVSIVYLINKESEKKEDEAVLDKEYMAMVEVLLSFIVSIILY